MPLVPRAAYRPDIDGLRAVAIIPVLLFHSFPALARGGFVGVDIFFVISGYLITSIILKDLRRGAEGKGGFSFRRFYAHRIRRIFPALILVLLGCLALGWFVMLADEYKQLGKHVVSGAGFIENFALWQEAGYFDASAESKPLLHLWSLGIEEQFYIFWPILLVVAARLRASVFLLMGGIAAASLAANIIAMNGHATLAFYSPFTRMWELMAGGTLAYLALHRGAAAQGRAARLVDWLAALGSTRTRANIESAAGLLLILGAVVFLNAGVAFPGWWALLPTIGACLLIMAGPEAWVNRFVLGSRLLVFVGLISYPLYLWHWPLLSFARILEGATPSAAVRGAALALAFVLSCSTYWLVEKRLRYLEHWGATLSLALVLVSLAGVGYDIFYREGLEFRLKGSELARVKFNITLQYQTQCRRDFPFAANAFCLRGSENAPPTVALLGDSHAMTLYPGLGQYYADRGENLVHFGIGGGIPFYGVERIVDGKVTNYYAKLFGQVLDYVSNDPRIKIVILMNKEPENQPLRYELDPANTQVYEVYGEAMAHTLARLVSAKKRVIVFLDNPMVNFDPGSCITRVAGIAPARPLCAIPRQQYEAESRLYRSKVEEVVKRFPSVELWDPAQYLCDARYCWARKDGKMLYGKDGQHLTIEASYWLAERFFPQ